MPYLVLRSKSALINMQEMMQWWSRSQLDIVVLAQRLRAYINKIAISLGTEMTSIMNVVSMKYDIECLKLIKDQIKENNGTLHGRYLKKLNSKSSQTFGLIKISLPHTQNHTLLVSYLIEEEIWSDLALDNIYVRIHCQGRVRYFRKDGNYSKKHKLMPAIGINYVSCLQIRIVWIVDVKEVIFGTTQRLEIENLIGLMVTRYTHIYTTI